MIEAFLQDCKIRGRTKRSLESYKSVLKEFLHHYPQPEKVDKRDLRDYLEYLQGRDLHIALLKSTRLSQSLIIIFRGKYNTGGFIGMMEVVSEKHPYTLSRYSYSLLRP